MASETLIFSERVRSILEQNFPDASVNLDDDSNEERIGGYIVWDGFEDQEPLERQHAIFDVLRKELNAASQRISLIFAYTPREWKLISED